VEKEEGEAAGFPLKIKCLVLLLANELRVRSALAAAEGMLFIVLLFLLYSGLSGDEAAI
jgi:hypothetical protein